VLRRIALELNIGGDFEVKWVYSAAKSGACFESNKHQPETYFLLVNDRQKTIRIIAGAFVLTATAIVAALAEEPDVAKITAIELAEFILVSGPDIPEEGSWETVELTDRWPAERYEVGREGWYRIKISLDDEPAERIGLFLRRLNMNAELYLNGSLIRSGGQFSEPVARNWNYPLYAEPPRALWRAGDNWIHIRHISYEAYGFLSPLYVGPATQLRQQYETVYTMQIRIAQFLFPVTLATAFFIFSIWLRRKKDTVYFWFAMAVAAWSIYIINMFLRQLVIPTKLWEWIAHISIELWVVAFFVFSYRFVGLSLGRLSWALPAYILIVAVTYAVGDLAQLSSSSTFFHGVSLMIGFTLVARLAVHWVRAKAERTVPLTGGLIVLLATGVHDWMFQTGLTSVTGTLSLHLHYYCAPLVFVFIAWHLTARYSTAVDELEDLNLHLAERISDAEIELADRYDQIKSMEQREAVLHERERIARDIHDTIGGRLITECGHCPSGTLQSNFFRRTHVFILTLPSLMTILMIGLLLLTGCVSSTGTHSQSGCPPGTVRIQDEDTDKYDCASQEQYEEIREIMDEHS